MRSRIFDIRAKEELGLRMVIQNPLLCLPSLRETGYHGLKGYLCLVSIFDEFCSIPQEPYNISRTDSNRIVLNSGFKSYWAEKNLTSR